MGPSRPSWGALSHALGWARAGPGGTRHTSWPRTLVYDSHSQFWAFEFFLFLKKKLACPSFVYFTHLLKENTLICLLLDSTSLISWEEPLNSDCDELLEAECGLLSK